MTLIQKKVPVDEPTQMEDNIHKWNKVNVVLSP